MNLREESQAREQRAELILEKGSPETIDEFTYLVPSQFDSAKKYRVILQIVFSKNSSF